MVKSYCFYPPLFIVCAFLSYMLPVTAHAGSQVVVCLAANDNVGISCLSFTLFIYLHTTLYDEIKKVDEKFGYIGKSHYLCTRF